MSIDNATLRQNEAATPDTSTWLSANAGSGKTRVLTDRVARLLLSGVSPQNILCLTYTKAAASEMQNRLFQTLGRWAMLDDTKLSSELKKLGEQASDDLASARRLFARAIETPGGLKIQTIHAYCAGLLRRFPMEAGVSPQFTEMDDRASKTMRQNILERMCESADDITLVQEIFRYLGGGETDGLLIDITKHRELFKTPLTREELKQKLQISSVDSFEDVLETCFQPGDLSTLKAFSGHLATGSAMDVKHAKLLAEVSLTHPNMALLLALEKFVLLQRSPFEAKIGKVPTKNLQTGVCESIMPQLNAIFERVEQARRQRIALSNLERNLALHAFSHRFCALYEAEKARRGFLDFDDLITKAGSLLTDPSIASWVLYRLDGGIDHILVDEAQDTSPAQWAIIDNLAREFTSGSGARDDVERTVFVVGDPKQSIYSFQGAEPAAFEKMRDSFASRLKDVGKSLSVLPLEHSFRSSAAILEFVDSALEEGDGLGGEFKHIAFFDQLPGRVDLWPAVEQVSDDEDRLWSDPVDRPSPHNHVVQLADHIAQDIQRLMETETIQAKEGHRRAVTAGDILILVRSRSTLFDEIIRACKTRNLPISGADRLKVSAELAVKDLTAILSFLATPEDDLSLACALKSPLFGWSEDQLFRLSHGRPKGKYLWRALSEQSERYEQELAVLSDLRDVSDFLRPYELIERILNRHQGRQKFLGRLGQEAADGIDAFLSQSMAFERLEVPSLTGFLNWLQADDITIKRQMDTVGDQIRVMTIHGAKGLEAPIVYLPDLARKRVTAPPQVLCVDGQHPVWTPPSNERDPLSEDALLSLRRADEEERNRLLYVAMTRAEQWLILAAAGDVGDKDTEWYRICERAMSQRPAVQHAFPTGQGYRLEHESWGGAIHSRPSKKESISAENEMWEADSAPLQPPAPNPVSPSQLGGEKTVKGGGEEDRNPEALAHGTFVHQLLEKLPQHPESSWAKIAGQLAKANRPEPYSDFKSALQEASKVIQDPELSWVFGPGSMAEVEISSPLEQTNDQIIHGILDRIIIRDDHILVVDFKTNRRVPGELDDVPEGILRQLGAYRAMLKPLYPQHDIQTAIIWTASRDLMYLPDALVDQAYARLDASHLPT